MVRVVIYVLRARESRVADVSPLVPCCSSSCSQDVHIACIQMLTTNTSLTAALQLLLPHAVPIHHLGLFRDKATMSAVEYYNNLPYHSATSSIPTPGPSELVILLDPVIATGATACAAIDTLRDWGVKKVIMLSVIASALGLRQAAELWPEGVEIWTAGVDEEVDGEGMIKPGLGDVGDRLFLTIGK
jgi:uracil phosphoribosyltransferase